MERLVERKKASNGKMKMIVAIQERAAQFLIGMNNSEF